MNPQQRASHWSMIFAILLGLVLTACAQREMTATAKPLVLGAVYSLTGNNADMGGPSSRGARLAVRQINAAGGIGGRPIRLIIEDGRSDPTAVRRAVDAIIDGNPGVPALFGLSDSDLARAAGQASVARQRVFLTSGATSPLLPAQVPDYLYLACFGDNVQAAAAAEWAYHQLDARKAVVVYNSKETYTTLLHKYFIDRFRSLGGRVTAALAYDPADMSGVGPDLPPADIVFLSAESAEEAQKGIGNLRAAGITVPILGGDGYDSEAVWNDHPEVKNVYYATHVYLGFDSPDRRVRNFTQAYHAAYGGNKPDAFAALSYDTVNLLAEAIRRAGSTAPEAVRRALAGIDGFKGVTGTISFSGGRQIPRKSVTIVEVKNGQRIFVKAFMPEAVPKP